MSRKRKWAGRLIGRLAPLRWPLSHLDDSCARLREYDPSGRLLKHRVTRVLYPFHALRYWWAICAINQEVRRLGRGLAIVDMGCGRGILRYAVPPMAGSRWIGLDSNVDHPSLAQAGYDEVHRCDFDGELPLPDASVDVVIALHVFEHLPRPPYTMNEIRRILRPGGCLITGSPVLPWPLALLRERQFRRQVEHNQRYAGDHVNAFWPARMRRLAEDAGFAVDHLSGSHFFRWKGNPLENNGWWVRLNQLWGALFPSLGQELYMYAHSDARHRVVPAEPMMSPYSTWRRRAPNVAWAGGLAVAVLAITLLLPIGGSLRDTDEAVVGQLIASHQDGNDRFFVLRHPRLEDLRLKDSVAIVDEFAEVDEILKREHERGRDAHFIVASLNSSRLWKPSVARRLRLVDHATASGQSYFLLGSEGYGQRFTGNKESD